MARAKMITVLPATRTFIHKWMEPFCLYSVSSRDVMEPSKIRIRRMRISCAKSVECVCGFVTRWKL